MRALLAGASGFIGGALKSSLQSDGHDVVTVGRPGSAATVTIDVANRQLDLGRLDGGLTGIDVVFQLLGEPLLPRRWGPSRLEAIRSSRIASTDLLARAIASCEGPRPSLVVGTAVGIYGLRGDEPLDESSGSGTGFLAELCRAWEQAASPARAAGARVVLARSGIVLGAGGGALATQLPLFRRGLGARLGDGRQWTSWIALADEVRALRYLAESEEISGAVNLTSPNPVTNTELTEAIAVAAGRPARLTVPRSVLRAAVGRRTADQFLLASQRVSPARLLDAGFSFELAELAGALDAAIA